ncbi:MAG: hypothetical protein IT452_13030 [Planctomycetia bacterium]|nr:hypothetical protein [Planctomycetia bacterium]
MLVVVFLLSVALLQFFSPSRHQPGSQCRINLNMLRSICRLYQERFGEYPTDFRAIFEAGLAGEQGELLVCPIHGNRVHLPPTPSWDTLQRWVDYDFRPPPGLARGPVNPDFVIAWDRKPHPDGARSVVTFGSYAGRLGEDDFRKALEVGR